MKRTHASLAVPALVFAAISVAGYKVQGWLGVLVWPLVFCIIVAAFAITRLIFNVFTGVLRTRARVNEIQTRLRLLSTDQLRELMRTPEHPDSQLALVELMQRGVDVRPTKEQLFGMLTSGNPSLCMDAMTNLSVFYPELPIPDGASNLDPPEIWRSRVQAFQNAG